MELLLVVLLLLVIAGLAFAWMKSRSGAPGGVMPGRSGGVRGRRRTAVAARHDPMADAVERHSAATDPHEAAEAELRLQAQANRVASELHAREAQSLESQAGRGGLRHSPAPPAGPGEPVYQDATPAYDDGRSPVYEDRRPAAEGEPPAYFDEQGRPVYEDDRPRY